MATEGLVQLWSKWGIQIMVLASFALQVFLLSTGGIRRRSSNAVLRFSLWLAYLLADSTAIYTLGHLSVSAGSKEQQLVAFWAPFLLVHLGGPDNITAYSLEDNRLWLRHLQTLTVQVLGAAYVVYKYVATGGTLLLCASISMFVVGVLKYGERTWALKHGNISSVRSSIRGRNNDCARLSELLGEGSNDEEILLQQAHSHLFLCKAVFTDAGLTTQPGEFPALYEKEIGATGHKRERVKKWVELELSLMYDILYTKAAVIHTWYGLCIHLVSLLGTATAFLLFQLGISHHTGDGRVNVIVSYVLLVGALLLEATSLCRAVLSSWTTSRLLLGRRGGNWKRHVGVLITSLRRRVAAARRRRWAGSIGQYNLLHLATRDRNKLWTRLATKMGLQDWWSKTHFSATFSPTDSFSMRDLENLVLPRLWQNSSNLHAFTTRGRSSLEAANMYQRLAEWSVSDIDLSSSILVWHIATDLYIHKSVHAQEEEQKLVQATQVLSNYMIFLLVAKPDMLPGHTRHDLYNGILQYLEDRWQLVTDAEDPSPGDLKPCCTLFKDLFHQEGPSASTIPRRKKLAEKLLHEYHADSSYEQYYDTDTYVREADVEHGIRLAKVLLDVKLKPRTGMRDTLEVIFKVWVEMMLYAAEHCSRDSHARELSNGGEFITIMWLLLHHLKDYNPINHADMREAREADYWFRAL